MVISFLFIIIPFIGFSLAISNQAKKHKLSGIKWFIISLLGVIAITLSITFSIDVIENFIFNYELSSIYSILLILVFIVIFYFFLIRMIKKKSNKVKLEEGNNAIDKIGKI